MIEYLDFIILGVLGWLGVEHYRLHGCFKRLEGEFKALH
jgi:hypothetical protein